MWMSDRARAPGPAADDRDDAKLREALTDGVRIVEDAIDATSTYIQTDNRAYRVAIPTERTGRAIVDALTEAGWKAPTTTTPVTPDTSRPCADCTAGVIRVPGITHVTFDCASCEGTGRFLPDQVRQTAQRRSPCLKCGGNPDDTNVGATGWCHAPFDI